MHMLNNLARTQVRVILNRNPMVLSWVNCIQVRNSYKIGRVRSWLFRV